MPLTCTLVEHQSGAAVARTPSGNVRARATVAFEESLLGESNQNAVRGLVAHLETVSQRSGGEEAFTRMVESAFDAMLQFIENGGNLSTDRARHAGSYHITFVM